MATIFGGHNLEPVMKFRREMIIAGVATVVFVVLAIAGCHGTFGSTNETTNSSPTPANVTATQLWEERESNPLRFDKTYAGDKLRITGKIWEIRRELVELAVEEEIYKRTGFILATVKLRGFSEAEILKMDKGGEITADCTVEEHDFWIQLNDCMLKSS